MSLPIDHCCVCRAPSPERFAEVDGRAYWSCSGCAAVFLDPRQRLSVEAERACYRLHQNYPDDPAYRGFLSQIATPLIAALPAGREGLDYGCGPGPALAAMLVEAGHGMSLYDPLFYPRAESLERVYDFVVCTETAEHFHDPFGEFGRLASLLRPGGCLAVMTRFLPDGQDFGGWHYRREPTHVVFYREATFRAIAARLGLSCRFPALNVVFCVKGEG